jgi:hypothetical protein
VDRYDDTIENWKSPFRRLSAIYMSPTTAQVFVARAEDSEQGQGPWIAFPAEIARQALQNTN